MINRAGLEVCAFMAAQTICRPKVVTAFGPSTAGDGSAFFGQVVPGVDAWIRNGPAVDGTLSTILRMTFSDDAIPTSVAFRAALVE